MKYTTTTFLIVLSYASRGYAKTKQLRGHKKTEPPLEAKAKRDLVLSNNPLAWVQNPSTGAPLWNGNSNYLDSDPFGDHSNIEPWDSDPSWNDNHLDSDPIGNIEPWDSDPFNWGSFVTNDPSGTNNDPWDDSDPWDSVPSDNGDAWDYDPLDYWDNGPIISDGIWKYQGVDAVTLTTSGTDVTGIALRDDYGWDVLEGTITENGRITVDFKLQGTLVWAGVSGTMSGANSIEWDNGTVWSWNREFPSIMNGVWEFQGSDAARLVQTGSHVSGIALGFYNWNTVEGTITAEGRITVNFKKDGQILNSVSGRIANGLLIEWDNWLEWRYEEYCAYYPCY